MSAVIALLLGTAAWAALPQGSPTLADRREALRAAISDARGSEPVLHDHLFKQLKTQRFLEMLDSAADYSSASKLGLHAGQVVDALARNTAPSAQRAFLALTADRVFLAHDERIIALIAASANVRPAPPALVRFWDRYSHPDDGFTPTTVTALVVNGDRAAIALLTKKMLDPAHSDDDKISWMRTDILSHRNDLSLLWACRQLVAGAPFRKHLRPLLVEALFDYRPGEWYRPASAYSAPALESASPAARAELRAIGELALRTVDLSPTQRAAITLRLRQIDKLTNQEPG